MDKEELKDRLSDLEYNVTQEGGTESPFTGEYYKTKEDGMYKCKVCDAPLFDSKNKV